MPESVGHLQPAASPALLFAEAMGLRRAGRLADAEKICHRILAAHPDHCDGRYLLGMIFHQRGDYSGAARELAIVLESNPNNAFVWNNRGIALNALKRLDEAVVSYDRALALRPDYAEAHCNRGNTLQMLKRFDEAVTSYDRAISLQPNYAEAFCNRAVGLHTLGRFEQALVSYDRALALRPTYAKALCNRGVVLYELLRLDEALASYDRALALRPDFAEAHYNRGNALQRLKRFDDAVASYDRAIALQPAYAEALCNRGVALFALKRFEEALASYDRVVSLRPDYAEAWSNRGNTLHALKWFDEAVASCDRALALRPDFAEALCNRGVALQAMERFDEALASFDRALALQPDYVVALCNRGAALQALERFEEALASLDRALGLQPDYAEAHSNRGMILGTLRRFDEALASCDRALALQSDYAEALCNRGNALHALKRLDEAITSYDRALAIWPDYVEVFGNRSVALYGLKRFEEALADSDRALVIRPDYAEAHFNEACCRLVRGDFVRGWEKNEWRWKTRERRNSKRNFTQPQWLGSNEIAGKTILLHAEQGLGDTIQFCRYAPCVSERGGRVILEVQKPLHGLMSTLAGVAQVVSRGDALPDFDVHCPLLSLPLAFGTGLETIPAVTPYLRASPQTVMDWDARLGPKTRPRIGLAWSGNPAHKNDHNRSIGLGALAPLLDFEATYVSLQPDVRAADAAVLQCLGNVVHFGEELKDFSDTAALIANLDLVIAVDTGVAHLAGALARPVWILLSFIGDWRWLIDRQDSPWYPTARLFRQDETQEWNNVLPRVRAALQATFALSN